MRLTHLGQLIALVILSMPSVVHGQDIPVQLLFDGEPLQVTAEPEFACLDRTRNTWIGCRIQRETDGTSYLLSRPAPGGSTLHVKIDENTKNPGRFPGDYDVFYPFEVTAAGPAELNIDLPRLMRVKAPWDNDRDLNGMLARPWSEKPGFTISRSGVATVTFEWDAVVPGAEYSYSIVTARNDPYLEGPEILRGTTTRTKLTVQLPPSPPDHYFRFGITARKDERPRRRLHHTRFGCAVLGVHVRRTVTPAAARAATRPPRSRTPDTSRPEREFVAEWKQRVPKPAWWDEVPDSSLRIRSLAIS